MLGRRPERPSGEVGTPGDLAWPSMYPNASAHSPKITQLPHILAAKLRARPDRTARSPFLIIFRNTGRQAHTDYAACMCGCVTPDWPDIRAA